MYRGAVCDIFHQFLTVVRLDSTFLQLDVVESSRFGEYELDYPHRWNGHVSKAKGITAWDLRDLFVT